MPPSHLSYLLEPRTRGEEAPSALKNVARCSSQDGGKSGRGFQSKELRLKKSRRSGGYDGGKSREWERLHEAEETTPGLPIVRGGKRKGKGGYSGKDQVKVPRRRKRHQRTS